MNNDREDRIILTGEVVESNKGQFKVRVNDNHYVMCTLSGKIRMNSVKILLGDMVQCEVSPYDLQKGRITYRNK